VVYYSSCYGCCGTAAPAGTAPAAPAKPKERLPEPKREASAGNVATVVIAAPADVQITVNGRTVVLAGAEKTFVTPELEPDANYSYTVKAQAIRDGQIVSKTRKVMVKAGKEIRVDFREMAAVPSEAGSVVTRD
jgi:uncharacterized protein (TIGR03000 family)